MSETSDMIRKLFGEGDDKRDAGLTTPEDVQRFDNIAYGPDPRWQVLDLYRPRDAQEKPLPVIVSVHGGGWVYGDKERYQYYCMSLAQRGFAVVNFTYRLSPEAKYPAALEDTNTVFQWVQNNAAQYKLDAAHVFAVGDSAGGNHLGLYAAICTNPAYAANYPFQPPQGFAPTAIALNCGAYVIDENDHALMQDYMPHGGTPEELALLDVTRHVTKDYPPTFLMTSTDDFLNRQPAALEARFIEEKVPFELHFYGDSEHPLGHVFHLNLRLEAGARCNDDECAFFRSFLPGVGE